MDGWLHGIPITVRADLPSGWVFMVDADDNLVPVMAFEPEPEPEDADLAS